MIAIVIEAQTGLPTINVQFDESASIDDLRDAWQDVLSGTLQSHVREAIRLECIKRGLEPNEVVKLIADD
jgi:hypothetical protein